MLRITTIRADDDEEISSARRILRAPQNAAAVTPATSSAVALRTRLIGFRGEEEDWDAALPKWIRPRLIGFGPYRASARGRFRVFNSAGYRFYRSNAGPPAEGDVPFATNATLPATPATTFADGVWYLSCSYFNGVLDSGFLPVGRNGETYLIVTVSAGVALPTPPSPPAAASLQVLAAGVIRIVATYSPVPDGASAANHWSINYTTDGSTPAAGTPSLTPAMSAGALSRLAYSLPAQVDGTIVKVQLQVSRGTGGGAVYSPAGAVLVAIASTVGPTAPINLNTWPGALP